MRAGAGLAVHEEAGVDAVQGLRARQTTEGGGGHATHDTQASQARRRAVSTTRTACTLRMRAQGELTHTPYSSNRGPLLSAATVLAAVHQHRETAHWEEQPHKGRAR